VEWKNPFRLVDTPDGLAYEVTQPGGPGISEFKKGEVHTLVAVQGIEGVSDAINSEPGHLSGTAIATLPFLWAPAIGTPIQVGEPNRDVVVSGLRYQVDPGGFAAIVYVSDSEGP
jgi:hypothetical protein